MDGQSWLRFRGVEETDTTFDAYFVCRTQADISDAVARMEMAKALLPEALLSKLTDEGEDDE